MASQNQDIYNKIKIYHVQTPDKLAALTPGLAALLQACVNPDPPCSSVGFRAPLSDEEAVSFWTSLCPRLVSHPSTLHLFVFVLDLEARQPDTGTATATPTPPSAVVATAQLHTIPKATHAHRGEVAKLLVRPDARRLRLGSRAMEHLEVYARDELGLEMLTLDTASETPAREFYRSKGWKEWGICPRYADFADGRRGDCSFFVKFLRE